ncbi:P-type conjugative transfer protein TrbJ [Gluconacetobacter azotocaptans]|uniref:P-type conjugative transfer protein TrbJ n=1 Tax=Gluconacetobacter azotocaptans TaxID=142834 RepID=A0A7W4JTQ1_9PROT|nr:P-type conjugative transfer protein TrbJ [Gluconacetobacter azotocaptans]MBB2190761.1 P-type conjugative transfer protein TrbJ [Gluconacetobacter azotocaptans]GBQ30693.1 conjugal transfer [Gluconacetobacter azotocaptans DSM 13594]
MRKLRSLAVVMAISVGAGVVAPPAHAQWAVIDSANLGQNILTAARSLQEVNNQITQIQQFVQMLENQARNLTSLPFSTLAQLQSSMTQLTGLMQQAQVLSYSVTQLQQQFQTLYPTYSGGNVTQAGLLADAQARWTASVASYQHSMAVQSQIVQAMPGDQAQITALMGQSRGAVGSLQAIQSGNQLLALQARQMAATQDLLAASGRASEADAMRRAEVENAAQAEWKRFYGNGVGYTPDSVTVFTGTTP